MVSRYKYYALHHCGLRFFLAPWRGGVCTTTRCHLMTMAWLDPHHDTVVSRVQNPKFRALGPL